MSHPINLVTQAIMLNHLMAKFTGKLKFLLT